MLPYWLIMAIPLVFMFFSKHHFQSISLTVISLIYIIFVGLRDEIGADWNAYSVMYESIYRYSFEDALSYTEFGYSILNWLLGKVDAGIVVINLIVAVIFVSGLVAFAKRTPNPWLALMSVTPYLVIAIGMSAERQAAAIGLIFHLLASWHKSIFKKIIFLISAFSFHYSAIVGIVFVTESIKIPVWLRYFLLFTVSLVSYPILSSTEIYSKYHQVYIEENLVSPGALLHVLLNALPAIIYFFFIKKWNANFGKNNVINLLGILSVLSIFGVFFLSSTGVDRLALYLSPIQMFVYSSLPYLFNKKHKFSLGFVIISYHCAVLYLWLNYANTAMPFLPYRNVLF